MKIIEEQLLIRSKWMVCSTVIRIIGVDSICTHSIAVDTEVLTRFWLGVVPYQYLVFTNIWEAIIFHSVGSQVGQN